MKPLTALKGTLYTLAAFGTTYASGMTADAGWHVPPSVVVGATVAAIIALRGYLDKSVSNDAREDAGLPRAG